jgi:hypothetical protein
MEVTFFLKNDNIKSCSSFEDLWEYKNCHGPTLMQVLHPV